jgi:hypothetical protein
MRVVLNNPQVGYLWHSAPPPDADEALACINSGRGEMYSVGLEHPGKAGLLDVKLMSASPAPPGFNDNTWVIQVNSMAAGVVGSPMDGATILVTLFMPDHQHSSWRPMPTARCGSATAPSRR